MRASDEINVRARRLCVIIIIAVVVAAAAAGFASFCQVSRKRRINMGAGQSDWQPLLQCSALCCYCYLGCRLPMVAAAAAATTTTTMDVECVTVAN